MPETPGGPAEVRPRIFYGWWLLAGSVLATALLNGLAFWSFGLYINPLEQEFGWSRAEVSLGFSFSLLASGVCSPAVGRLVDARGPRFSITVGVVLTAASYLLLAMTSSLWQWYLFLAMNGAVRQLMFVIPFQALISRWFSRRRGMALGLMGTGFSLGGFAVVPIMQVVIDTFGWDVSFLLSGAALLVVFLAMSIWLVRDDPADRGVTVDGDVVEERVAGSASAVVPGLSLAQAVRTPLFWLISMAMFFFFFAGVGWIVHQVPFYQSVGISRTTAALLASLAAGTAMLWRTVVGLLADRIERIEMAAVWLVIFLSAGQITLLIDTSTVGIAIFLVFYIAGSGGGPMIEGLLVSRAFGIAQFGAILGVVSMFNSLGMVASPVLAGAIFDETGSYDWVLVMLLSSFITAGVLFFIAGRVTRPVLTIEEAASA